MNLDTFDFLKLDEGHNLVSSMRDGYVMKIFNSLKNSNEDFLGAKEIVSHWLTDESPQNQYTINSNVPYKDWSWNNVKDPFISSTYSLENALDKLRLCNGKKDASDFEEVSRRLCNLESNVGYLFRSFEKDFAQAEKAYFDNVRHKLKPQLNKFFTNNF